MKKKLQELALMLGGFVIGTPEVEVTGVTNIEEAGEQDITFAVSLNLDKAARSKAAAVIVSTDIKEFPKPVICVDNPRAAFAKLLELFYIPPVVDYGIHPTAIIGQGAIIGKKVAIMAQVIIAGNVVIGDNTVIYPHTYIGQACRLGEGCLIYPNVTIRENTHIGKQVIIHSGAVLGSDGFGFITNGGKHYKVPQVGNVIIGDYVEIGVNAAIDRATSGSTIVGKGTKIDNLVHLAHNVVIGENCLIVAQTGIAGSAKVGNNVTFAGQSGSAGHLTIGDNSVFAARTAIISDIPANSFFAGFPAKPHKEWLRTEAATHKVPDLLKKVRELEKRLNQLEKGSRE